MRVPAVSHFVISACAAANNGGGNANSTRQRSATHFSISSRIGTARCRATYTAREGRPPAILLTPYPPGIPLLIPGERFNKTIVDYLRFARDFNERFPGFETDVHGLVKREVDGKRDYFVDCVRQD